MDFDVSLGRKTDSIRWYAVFFVQSLLLVRVRAYRATRNDLYYDIRRAANPVLNNPFLFVGDKERIWLNAVHTFFKNDIERGNPNLPHLLSKIELHQLEKGLANGYLMNI